MSLVNPAAKLDVDTTLGVACVNAMYVEIKPKA